MNAKEMAKLVMDSGVCIKYRTIPDVGQSILYSDTIADKLLQQDQVITARVAEVERLTKERDDAREQLAGHNERENSIINGARKHRDALEQELAAALSEVKRLKAATVKESLTVPDDEFEVVRPDANGNVVWGDLSQPLACLDSYRYAFVCWIWSCGPHGEREAGTQMWWDDAFMYVARPTDTQHGAIRTATRVGAVMRRMK